MRRLFPLLLMMGSCLLARGQMLHCEASNDRPTQVHWWITCLLDKAADQDNLHQLKVSVLDPAQTRTLTAVVARTNPEGFDLNMQEDLTPELTYFIFAQGLTFSGKPPEEFLNCKLKFAQPAPTSANGSPPASSTNAGAWKTYFSKITAADSKEKSNLYFAGVVWTSAGNGWHWIGTSDLKVEVPFRLGETRLDQQISPFFTLQSSNDPSSDPDSLKAGARWTARVFGIHGWFKGTFAKEEVRLESTRDFTDRNVIMETRLTSEIRSIVPKSKIFHGYLDPFVGLEAGRNLVAPLAAVDGTARVRPLAGGSFVMTFTKIPHLRSIILNADYIRRWPLETELGYKADSNNVLQLTSVGTKPKDRVTSKISFMFRDWIGAYFGHEYGSEPPAFQLVDNKLTTGLTIQAQFGASR